MSGVLFDLTSARRRRGGDGAGGRGEEEEGDPPASLPVPEPERGRGLRPDRRRGVVVAAVTALTLLFHGAGSVLRGVRDPFADAAPRYGPPLNLTSAFVQKFEDVLLHDLGRDVYVPLVLEEGRLLCRREHRRRLSGLLARTRSFVQMARAGLALERENSTSVVSVPGAGASLPVLVREDDDNGCNLLARVDRVPFPRLTWSMLSPSRGRCAAIGMPSYEMWRLHHRRNPKASDWERDFRRNERRHPWRRKIDKAVWRGSTTYQGSVYGDGGLGETPRGRLVRLSLDRPDILDARFHKIVLKFKGNRTELAREFGGVAWRMLPEDMMKYKAIIDIDGNNWSSRFGMLLCSNSVVIKVEPDFVEHFYHGDNAPVQPGVHYVPATLDNVTEAIAYVLDASRDAEMRATVAAANSWCAAALNGAALARDAVGRIREYEAALDNDDGGRRWRREWDAVRQRFKEVADDLVDCDVRHFLDRFMYLAFESKLGQILF